MHRLLRISVCSCLFAVACDKPVPDEIVAAPPKEATSGGFADGSVIRDELDAGLDAGQEEGDASEPDGEDVPFSKSALLSAAANCALNQLNTLRAAVLSLRDASARWAMDRTEANGAAARAAFRTALSALQVAEAMKFGPAALSTSIGGQNLGGKLYTPFPSLDRCAIDRQLALGSYSAKEIASAPAGQRGLAAFEYLAYYVAPENTCLAGNDINTSGSWATLSAEELAQRRADFAAAIAADVLTVCDQLLADWSAKGGNFLGEITQPGGKLFRDEMSALNTINSAMFYVDLEVKDVKLGRILNRNGATCQTVTCPEALEAPLSGLSVQNLQNNLIGFRDLFQGCGSANRGLGFDDWLEAVGASDTEQRLLDALADAEAAFAAIHSLEDALNSDRASVMKAYDAIKLLTDRMKGELTSVLGLEPPAGLEGDND
jgi:predicted lipoprotein